jgi:hypothetical protein
MARAVTCQSEPLSGLSKAIARTDVPSSSGVTADRYACPTRVTAPPEPMTRLPAGHSASTPLGELLDGLDASTISTLATPGAP